MFSIACRLRFYPGFGLVINIIEEYKWEKCKEEQAMLQLQHRLKLEHQEQRYTEKKRLPRPFFGRRSYYHKVCGNQDQKADDAALQQVLQELVMGVIVQKPDVFLLG